MITNLKSKYNIFVIFSTPESLKLHILMDNIVEKFYFPIVNSDCAVGRLKCFEIREIFKNILHVFSIHLVHVHHTKGIGIDIFDLAKEENIPIIYTLHDYFCLCPYTTLLDSKGRLCEGKKEYCSNCLKEGQGIYDGNAFIEKWRKDYKEVLSSCTEIIVPSESMKNIMDLFGKEIKKKIRVIEHGYGVEKILNTTMYDSQKNLPNLQKKSSSSKFKVAFIGGLTKIKGSNEIYQIINSDLQDIQWFLIGEIGDERLKKISRSNVVQVGKYTPNNIVSILNDLEVDVVCLLSKCPETFSYTLSDAIASKKPVIVTNVGALKERVEAYGNGYIVNIDNVVVEVLQLLRELKKRGEKYTAIYEKAKVLSTKATSEMVKEYTNIYEIYMKDKNVQNGRFNIKLIYDAYLYGNGRKEIELTNICNNSAIENTLAFQFANYIANMSFPFKEQIREKLLKIIKRGKNDEV